MSLLLGLSSRSWLPRLPGKTPQPKLGLLSGARAGAHSGEGKEKEKESSFVCSCLLFAIVCPRLPLFAIRVAHKHSSNISRAQLIYYLRNVLISSTKV